MTEWWKALYERPVYLEVYQAEDIEIAAGEIESLVSAFKISPPLSILDCPCGYGRHALELAARGFAVSGADLSPLQIEEANRLASERGLSADFRVADARALPWPDGTFDLSLNMFLSLGYFDIESENQRQLDELVRVTKQGGRIVIDQWNREHEIRSFGNEQQEVTDAGVRIRKEWRFDPIPGRIYWKNTAHFPDGRIEEWEHSVRAYSVRELCDMVAASGASVAALWGDLDGSPWELDSPRTVIVAEKD
ncbi:MAG: class I SAM-dependent methyltransferase [bacterium]|jgi:SAM-dependent methyltransferase